ncbi:hypothetical protein [Thiolapillus sp.]|uniref:hypothetical protein n=1 Tax=Thiolapillus sp. TaxID=2017437 RepID=UPI002600AF5A|nr:hypothetical protein [Thiolapillus sp.]
MPAPPPSTDGRIADARQSVTGQGRGPHVQGGQQTGNIERREKLASTLLVVPDTHSRARDDFFCQDTGKHQATGFLC